MSLQTPAIISLHLSIPSHLAFHSAFCLCHQDILESGPNGYENTVLDFDVHDAAKIFKTAENVAYRLNVVACLVFY